MRRTEGIFAKEGSRSLLLAKFLPGLGTVAPPLAGIFHMRLHAISAIRLRGGGTVGRLVSWAGIRLQRTDRSYRRSRAVSRRLAAGYPIAAFVGYIGNKYIARQRFIRELRVSRITVEELKTENGSAGRDGDRRSAPRARFRGRSGDDSRRVSNGRAGAEEKDEKLPRDRQIILYCTCPNEATSAQLAILLRKQGIQQIRPLQGGSTRGARRGIRFTTRR